MSTDDAQPEASKPMRRSDLVVAAIPVMVLLAVAGVQFFAAHTTTLTPWKGGGFGMFSTVDVDTARFLSVYLEIEGREHPVEIHPAFDTDIESLRPMPTEERTEKFARHLARQRWVELPDRSAPALIPLTHVAQPVDDRHWTIFHPLHDADSVVEVEGVRVQVWAPRFEADGQVGGGTLHRTKIQDVYVPAVTHPSLSFSSQ